MVWQVAVPGTQTVTLMNGTSSSINPAFCNSNGPASTVNCVELLVDCAVVPPLLALDPPIEDELPPLPHAARKKAKQSRAANRRMRYVFFTRCPQGVRRPVPLRERKPFQKE